MEADDSAAGRTVSLVHRILLHYSSRIAGDHVFWLVLADSHDGPSVGLAFDAYLNQLVRTNDDTKEAAPG